MNLIDELQRRNVFRMALLYVVGSWLVLQIGDLLFDLMGLPDWALRIVLGILVLGFPVALVFSWIYELTPEGIKKETDVDRSQSITGHTAKKLDVAVLAALGVAVALLAIDRYTRSDRAQPSPVESSPAADAAQPEAPKPAPASADPRQSIAVLPFVNMSDDPSNEYFSDGIAEELLNTLVKLDELRVASRTSSFYFKGKDVPLGEIGAELDVDHILEGSVRKAGDQVRITAQLIDVSTDSHLWSESYDRRLEDIFAVQSEIARAIVDAMQVVLGAGEVQELDNRPTGNLTAYELFLEGRFLLARRGEANMRKAASLLEQAVELDPEFALAWATLAQLYALLPAYAVGVDAAESNARAKQAIERALTNDPDNALAYTVRGLLSSYLLDWDTAREAYSRAIELAPRDTTVNNLYGDYLVMTGDFDRALEIEGCAVELDPLAEVHRRDLADLLLILGRNEEAVASARRAADLDPNSERALEMLGFAQARSGAWDESSTVINRLGHLETADPLWVDLASFRHFWLQGDQEQARPFYEKLKDRDFGIGSSELIIPALKYEGVEGAVAMIRNQLEHTTGYLTWPGVVYLPEQISTDPRWLEVWQSPGLAELIEIRRANQANQENLPPAGSYLLLKQAHQGGDGE